MRSRYFLNVFATSILAACSLISCNDKAPEKKDTNVAASASPKANDVAASWSEPAITNSSVADTAKIKCYITTYTEPHLIKIFQQGYEVNEKDLPAFIALQKEELKKYRVHLLSSKKGSGKKTTDLIDLIQKNGIKDFEIVEDGKLLE